MNIIDLNSNSSVELKNILEENLAIMAKNKKKKSVNQEYALIIDGDTLTVLFNTKKKDGMETLKMKFLRLCIQCKSVICCRVR
jgi:hypothetical protein